MNAQPSNICDPFYRFPCGRICKDEVISDYQKEVKKIKDVKVFISRKPGLHHQTDSFLMVSNLAFFFF